MNWQTFWTVYIAIAVMYTCWAAYIAFFDHGGMVKRSDVSAWLMTITMGAFWWLSLAGTCLMLMGVWSSKTFDRLFYAARIMLATCMVGAACFYFVLSTGAQ